MASMASMASFDCAYGAFLGAAVGDAAGAPLEFMNGGHRKIPAHMIHQALTFPGGGVIQVAPGQITDDTELALSMGAALRSTPLRYGFPEDRVAYEYVEWFRSRPFDIGGTCARAFQNPWLSYPTLPIGQAMMNKAHTSSMASEANGALMRCVPLAIWASNHQINETDWMAHWVHEVIRLAKCDAALSHPSPVCQDCNALYCVAIAYLIRHPQDAHGAIELIDAIVDTGKVPERFQVQEKQEKEQKLISICPNVRQWIHDTREHVHNLDAIGDDAINNIGWVRHGFRMAFWCLRNQTLYREAIARALSYGGDVDTNACIVGGLIGALWGESAGIPSEMKAPVLALKCWAITRNDAGHQRPAKYSAANIRSMTVDLLNASCYSSNDVVTTNRLQ